MTVIATIFMPLTFLTAVFGMNFTEGFEILEYQWAYPLGFWVVVALLTIPSLYYFYRKGWLDMSS